MVKIMRDYAETRLQMASSDYLNGIIWSGKTIIKQKIPFPGLLFTHPSNEHKDEKETFWAIRKGQRSGTPDWLFWWNNGFGAIELKVNKNLSLEQRQWRDFFIGIGGKYSLCKTVAEIRDCLISWGLECKNTYCVEPRLSKTRLQELTRDWQKP